jgi:zinc protease
MDTHIEDFRREPPAPLPPRALNLPSPEETTLKNGLKVVVVEQNRLPLVNFRLAFPRGDAFDPPHLPGLTDVMTDMLGEGTASRASRQIAEEVARYGATLSAGANSDFTTVAASALSSYTDEILELMADVTLRPTFPENELALSKANSQQNLIAQRGQPSFLATEALARVVFGQHPYAVVSPNSESIEAMTRADLSDFHGASFIPNGAVMIVVGDVRRERILENIEQLFGGWPAGAAREANFPSPPARTERAAYIVDRPGSAQSNIVIANLGIKRTDPDYFPMLLMHTVLGANASSRLFMNLREEKGYTYGAYSTLDARRFAGAFRATAEVRTPVTGASLKEFFYELERIRAEAVGEQELNDAKTYLTGIFPIRLETQEGLVEQLAHMEMFGLPSDYLHTYREHIQRVTAEDVQRVANKYVTPEVAAVVIVGDAATITEQVKPFAEKIEFFDNLGQRKDNSHTANAPDEGSDSADESIE